MNTYDTLPYLLMKDADVYIVYPSELGDLSMARRLAELSPTALMNICLSLGLKADCETTYQRLYNDIYNTLKNLNRFIHH